MEATLEPRLVMKGEAGKPCVSGEFFVADYQRGYRWGREEVRLLLDDIKANREDAEKRRELPADYYLQPIVVLKRDEGTWELVDGQQRLTTLFLITKYVATKFADAHVEYGLTYETRDREGYSSSEYLKSVGTPDAEAHRSDNIDFHHIAQAYDTIVEWFGEQGSAGQAAIDVHSALSKWVYVIWYEAPTDTNPNELFARLNRGRILLTDSELIKALVLSKSGASGGSANRQHEIAAQWDSFERDLRDHQFWAFLTGSTETRSTHIDFLFESMTPNAGLRSRPRYWTFGEVWKDVQQRGAAAFWRGVVRRHGLLLGWYHDRELYHRIGYLIATGDSITDLIHVSRSETHSAFRERLIERTRTRLNLTDSDVSLLRYDKDPNRCTDVLLLMNVETILHGYDPGSRFSFHAYADAGQGWSLEHIHARNSQVLKTEKERRDWIKAHLDKIRRTTWTLELQSDVEAVAARMIAHLALPTNKTDDAGFESILDTVFALFSAADGNVDGDDMHGLGNLALLQRDFNSMLSNAVFSLKRERILQLDEAGAYILPCTRNVFLKYYMNTADEQLSIWSPQDQDDYYKKLVEKVSHFLLPDPTEPAERLVPHERLTA